MTGIESRSYCRVAVVAPNTRVDLALPVDIPIIDLLPALLEYTGEVHDDGGGQHAGWQLSRIGHGELDGGRTLRSLDVVDGEVLRLTPRESRTPPPLFDDIVDAIASAQRQRLNRRSANPGIGAAAIIAAFAAGAVTMFYRSGKVSDAYLCGAIALALLGIGTAVAKGARSRVIGTAITASGIPYALLCGLIAVPGNFGHWGLLLGCALAVGYSLAALLALGTGAAVWAAATTAGILGGLSALVAGLLHEHAIHVVAGTIAVALGALGYLPRIAIRLAHLPLGTVPTTSAELAEQDDLGDLDDVTAKARVASEYLLGALIGCAGVVAFTAVVLAHAATAESVALAAVAVTAMALRARTTPGLGARIALLSSALAGGLFASAAVVYLGRQGDGTGLLAADLAVGLLAIFVTAVVPRTQVSPQSLRLIDFFESGLLIAVLPLAVGVMGLYSTLRHL